jgi:glycosyltransferase involved in cell wall biosynthesis
MVDTFSPAMAAAIQEETARAAFDLVIASQIDMVPYALGVAGAPLLLEELEVSVIKARVDTAASVQARVLAALTWFKLRAYLRNVLPRFAACTVASHVEWDNVAPLVREPARVHVIPNAVDVSSYRGEFGPVEPNTLVYSGALTYGPNRDAVTYFLSEIYPHIVDEEPKAQLRVTGSLEGVDVRRIPGSEAVNWTGHLDDVRPTVARSWASMVPLRIGGGTRLKILEALALGTPVVATSKGAEGLQLTSRGGVLIADEPAAFASRVVQLLRDPALRQQLGASGRDFVASHYDAAAVGQTFCSLVERVCGN